MQVSKRIKERIDSAELLTAERHEALVAQEVSKAVQPYQEFQEAFQRTVEEVKEKYGLGIEKTIIR